MINTDTSIIQNSVVTVQDTPSASPQLENGYTSIANELLEAIYNTELSPYEFRLLLFIARITYGFKRKTDTISISQFTDGIKKKDGDVILRGTNINHRNVCKVLNRLVSRNIIVKIRNGYVTEYGIQKNYLTWLSSDNIASDTPTSVRTASGYKDTTPVSVETLPSVLGDTESSVRGDTHQINKETITKETIPNKEFLIKRKYLEKDFIEYFYSLKEKYPSLDYENNFILWKEHWNKEKKELRSPKKAWYNWLENALKFQAAGRNNSVKGNGHKPGIKVNDENSELLDELDRR